MSMFWTKAFEFFHNLTASRVIMLIVSSWFATGEFLLAVRVFPGRAMVRSPQRGATRLVADQKKRETAVSGGASGSGSLGVSTRSERERSGV
jgi:hypothetical protein